MSVKCKCGRPTNNKKTGVCAICEMDAKLEAGSRPPVMTLADLARKYGDHETDEPSHETEGQNNETEEKMAEKKKCSCGCGKNSLKGGLAYACYKKKFGVAPCSPEDKKNNPGLVHPRLNKNIQAREKKVKRTVPETTGQLEIVSKGHNGNVVEALKAKREEYQQEILLIDSALLTIDKHA
jgi:hypothetical protein